MRADAPPTLPDVRHEWVDVSGARLHVATAGSGPPLVLLHGWPQHWYAWREVIGPLSAHHRVICPDIRGLGWSAAFESDWSLRRLAADVIAVAEALGEPRFGLVGHDWGAAVGYRLALDHPGRLHALMPLAALNPWSAIGGTSRLVWRPWHVYVAAASGALANGPLRVPQVSLRTWRHLGDFTPAERASYLEAVRRPASCRATTCYYRAIVPQALAIALRARRLRIDLPVLHLNGAHDPLTQHTSEGWRPFASAMTLEAIPDCGHFIPEERPAELTERIPAFFAEHAA